VGIVGSFLTLLVMAAGLACLAGATKLAGKLGRFVFGAVVVLAVGRCLTQTLVCRIRGGAVDVPVAGLLLVLAAVAVAAGYIAWRGRTARQRAIDAWSRRHGQHRERSLPPPPPATDSGG
jgi:hypothetical protein